MQLLPILPTRQENSHFLDHPDTEPALSMTVDFFNQIGYNPPWIGYFVEHDGNLVGSGAFKGAPEDGRVEVAYNVFPPYQQRGIGSQICHQLVELARKTDPAVTIIAQTLPEDNYSTRILQKNGFIRSGTAWDNEAGEVWEWEYGGI